MKHLALIPDLVPLHLLSLVSQLVAVADAKKVLGTALTARAFRSVRMEAGLLHSLWLPVRNAQLEFLKISKLLPSKYLGHAIQHQESLFELHTVRVDELSHALIACFFSVYIVNISSFMYIHKYYTLPFATIAHIYLTLHIEDDSINYLSTYIISQCIR